MKTFQPLRLTAFLLFFLFTGITSCKKENSEISVANVKTEQDYIALSKAMPHTKNYSGEVAYKWFNLIADISRTHPYSPVQSSRIFAYTGLALYESVLPGMPSYQSMYTQLTGETIDFEKKKDYYWPAVANAVIFRSASKLMSFYGPSLGLTSMQNLETQFNNQFLSVISQEQLEFSRSFGISVADKVYDWSLSDGTIENLTCPAYVPLGTPGAWEPTPPFFLPAAGYCQGNLRTFIPNIKNTLVPPTPPVYSTVPGSAFYEAALQTYNMRNNITTEDMKISDSWRELPGINFNGFTHVIKITTKLAETEKLDLETCSVMFAKQGMAISDAIVLTLYTKFVYNLLRPVSYIRNVLGHTTWSSYVYTPQHPSYVSVTVCAVTAGFAIASKYFGNQYKFVDDAHDFLYGSWTYNSFDEAIQNVKKARTVSGANFVFSGDASIELGDGVGNAINNLPFKKP